MESGKRMKSWKPLLLLPSVEVKCFCFICFLLFSLLLFGSPSCWRMNVIGCKWMKSGKRMKSWNPLLLLSPLWRWNASVFLIFDFHFCFLEAPPVAPLCGGGTAAAQQSNHMLHWDRFWDVFVFLLFASFFCFSFLHFRGPPPAQQSNHILWDRFWGVFVFYFCFSF